jgi:hypothetical protein
LLHKEQLFLRLKEVRTVKTQLIFCVMQTLLVLQRHVSAFVGHLQVSKLEEKWADIHVLHECVGEPAYLSCITVALDRNVAVALEIYTSRHCETRVGVELVAMRF